jgi:hypothetical protein
MVYLIPFVAFMTALLLNLLMLSFERETAKMPLALLACYINLLAATNDFLSWQGYAPVWRTPWGHSFLALRTIMWAHTTPAMIYMLSTLSDFPRNKVLSLPFLSWIAYFPPLIVDSFFVR